ncbi:DUF1868 domain-containing protein [Niveispirillum sp.]|uniref:DUF1868 domain-containing protein n=1 Tax=Niveispirillum sp. TaxID=1917217 RepID=UPI001B7A7832|nr:DUF1868 domain-containing protein [Niveispirillum sp.]MBP7338414.1 DUF1868 domain-containing protein [Niveispirillum sp.]
MGERQEIMLGRRHLMALGVAAGAGVMVPSMAGASEGRGRPTTEVGRKFQADGRVGPFHGNTIVCHIPQQGEHAACFNALLDIYRDLPARPFAANITALPPSSYHMTLFDGANETARTAGLWPPGLALDSSIEDCHREVGRRLEGFALDTPMPIRMRVDTEGTGIAGNALTIPLLPVDDAENARLRRLRDRLSVATGIRSPRHDEYRFHISLAYVLWELSATQVQAVRQAMGEWMAMVAKAAPVILLDAPEFCTFKDMFAFNRIRYLT